MLIDYWNDVPEETLPIVAHHEFYGQWVSRVLSERVALRAGHRYALKLEFFDDEPGRSLAMLHWSSASLPEQAIPASCLYLPRHASFTHAPDSDGDGMPDAWERAFGLNPASAEDASADPDADGLANLAEFQNGSDPHQQDSDADGIPDGWAVKYGLHPGGEPDALADADGDGLSNLEEYRLGSNPLNADSDGDGLPDQLELIETNSDVWNQEIVSIETVAAVPGAAAVGRLGEWMAGTRSTASQTISTENSFSLASAPEANTGGNASLPTVGSIQAVSKRGWVEFELAVPRADMFRLEVHGGPSDPALRGRDFPLVLSVDGEFLDRVVLDDSGSVHAFTPWLAPGPHRVRVFWDNVSKYHPALAIHAVKLIALQGRDNDANGVSDWVDTRLRVLSGIDSGTGILPVSVSGEGAMSAVSQPSVRTGSSPISDPPSLISSFTSPFCLEGRDRFLSMASLAAAGQAIFLQPGAGPRWFANVPLSADATTRVEASFQNGGLRQVAEIRWTPLDIARVDRITLRRGDSLLLSLGSIAAPAVPSGTPPDGREMITLMVGETRYHGSQPVPVRFDVGGVFTVRGSDATGASHTLEATVVDWMFDAFDAPENSSAADAATPAAWTGRQRAWTLPPLPSDVILQTAPGNILEASLVGRESPRAVTSVTGLSSASAETPSPDPGSQTPDPTPYRLQTDAARTTHTVARLGESGPILARADVRGFSFHGGGEAGLEVIEFWPDGTRLIEMRLVMSPVRPQVRLHLSIFVGGVIFDDGTVEKNLTAADFNPLGEATVRFLWPKEAQTSVCHQVRVYDGDTLLGID